MNVKRDQDNSAATAFRTVSTETDLTGMLTLCDSWGRPELKNRFSSTGVEDAEKSGPLSSNAYYLGEDLPEFLDRHLDGVPRRAEGRGVTQIVAEEFFDGGSVV